jgi:hypothetical protein
VRACDLIGYNRSNLCYHRAPIDDEQIASRLKTLAAERPRRKRKVNYVRGNFIEPVSRPNE